MDEQTKRDLAEYVDRWRLAAPVLQEQRLSELRRLDDETARVMTLDLFSMWRPSERDDFAATLVEQQRVFQLWQQRQRTHP
jgi:hypothetical protein